MDVIHFINRHLEPRNKDKRVGQKAPQPLCNQAAESARPVAT